MNETKTARLFFGGKPTEPSVALIEEATKERVLGDLIPYEEIAKAIGESPRSNRFRHVVRAWRRKLFRDKNIKTESLSGEGIRLCLEAERAGLVFGRLRRAGKAIVRGHHEAEKIPMEKLTSDLDRRRAEHARRVSEVAAKAVTASVNELALTFRAPRQLPHASHETELATVAGK